MPTLTLKATEMTDAKVARISLVSRAATRIPFRVVKEESTMKPKFFDLASVIKRERAPEHAEIVGVITMKSEVEGLKGVLTEAGFSVEKASEMADGSVVLAQSDDMSGESAIVRISDDIALAVKGLRPYSMDVSGEDGTSFADLVAAQGFYPGVGTMMDTLRAGVITVAEKSDSPSDAATRIAKMFDEAKKYAVGMVQSLPSKAFKLEDVLVDVDDATDATDATDAADAATDTAEGDKATKGEASEATGQDAGAADDKGAADETTNKQETAEAKPATALKAEDIAALLSKSMETAMKPVMDSMAKINATVEGLTTRVEGVEAVAKAAKEAVEGTVEQGGEGDDHIEARKSDKPARGGEIDTAFMPRKRASR